MSRWIGRSTVSSLLAVGAIALAGCGLSSRKDSYGVGLSTSVNDPAFRSDLIHRLQELGFSSADIGSVADCAIAKFPSKGINDVGDFILPTNLGTVKRISSECADATQGQ